MRNILIGFIFIFLDFNLDLGNSRIGLIPDFVGYIALINGLVEMSKESPLFMKVKSYASGMAVFSGILYVMDLLGISVSLGGLSYVLAIISTVISLYISYNIVMGVIDMESKNSKNFNGDSLKSAWTIIAVFNALTYVLLLFPPMAFVCMIVTLIVTIFFLFAINTSKNLYYNTVK